MVDHDESRGTGEWATIEDTIHIVAPDKEELVRGWFAEYFKYHGGRDRQITMLTSRPLTAFIQEHQY